MGQKHFAQWMAAHEHAFASLALASVEALAGAAENKYPPAIQVFALAALELVVASVLALARVSMVESAFPLLVFDAPLQ